MLNRSMAAVIIAALLALSGCGDSVGGNRGHYTESGDENY